MAAQDGHIAIAKLLLSAGANPDYQSGHDGSTPLMYAARRGHREITHFLIARGASVNSCDVVGSTPLAEAAYHGDEGVISILITSGADIDKKDFDGRTPLMQAVLGENETAAKILLEKGADINCVDVNGNTPLLLAAGSDNPAIVKVLIERGAWVDTRNKDGDTALILAVKIYKSPEAFPSTIGRDEIVSTLLEYGANPNSQDAQDDTALSLAITGGLNSTVRILLDHLASMDIPNSLGQTPWSLAQQNENIARMLNVDPASLDDKHGKLPSVCPPAPNSSPVTGRLREPLPSESRPMSEPAEERRQTEKRKFGESLWDMVESMAGLGAEYRRIYRRT
jgi:ankyrin repeat protein